MKTIEKGSNVSVHYTGTFEDGKTFDSSEGREPLKFTVGSGMMIKGFDEGIVGMKVGDEKELTLKPEEAYGERNEQMIQTVPKKAFPDNIELKPGINLVLQSPEGQRMTATVLEIGDDTVKIDLNHPLAGKTLNFKVKIVEIE